jgi:hypothetical protein
LEEERWNDGDKREYLPHLSPLYMYDYYYKNITIFDFVKLKYAKILKVLLYIHFLEIYWR